MIDRSMRKMIRNLKVGKKITSPASVSCNFIHHALTLSGTRRYTLERSSSGCDPGALGIVVGSMETPGTEDNLSYAALVTIRFPPFYLPNFRPSYSKMQAEVLSGTGARTHTRETKNEGKAIRGA